MPAFILGSTRCVISGKAIKPGDTIVRFTLWPGSNPLGICHDDVALRAEFNKWMSKQEAIEILSQAWKENFRGLKSGIVHGDDHFLLFIPKLDTQITIFFFKHAFYFSVNKPIWNSFCRQITRDLNKITIDLSPTRQRQLTLKRDKTKKSVKICYKANPLEEGFQDCVELSLSEWSGLLSIISANKDLDI